MSKEVLDSLTFSGSLFFAGSDFNGSNAFGINPNSNTSIEGIILDTTGNNVKIVLFESDTPLSGTPLTTVAAKNRRTNLTPSFDLTINDIPDGEVIQSYTVFGTNQSIGQISGESVILLNSNKYYYLFIDGTGDHSLSLFLDAPAKEQI